MALLVIMPKQGQSVESCIIGSISRKKGELVKKGETLFSYETDKASFEEESPVDGTILEIFCREGDEVPVLDPMMIIGEPGEDYSHLISENKEEGGKSKEAEALEKDNKSDVSVKTELQTPDLKPETRNQEQVPADAL